MTERIVTNRESILAESKLLEIFSKGFTAEELAEAYTLTVEETTIKDRCADYCRFILADKNGMHIACRTVAGY